MKTILKVIVGFVVIVGIGAAALFFFTSGARDTASKFVTLASSGDVAGAHALMHSALQDAVSVDQLVGMMEGVKPYTDVSFGSMSASSGEATEVKGTATTADGCESLIEFKVLSDKIIAFDIQPLCR